ncbi:MAG: AIR synthase family protein [Clostridiales Family XIII bacterium]|jgi:hydrogenase expression/formation protein HypE|nr:AIR synthase family protein [Clostridiales Family XIII bacterium]
MKIGKLENDLLKRIVFSKIQFRREEVLTRPGIGEDCAVIDFGAYDCVLSTDPITAAADSIGKLAVHVSCNDIASNGVQPLGVLLTVLLPPETTEAQIEILMEQAASAAEDIGVEIIGGHTEITEVVRQPVIVSTAVGRKLRTDTEDNAFVPGDRILVTKQLGLEGSAILAAEHSEKLKGILTEEEIAHAASMLKSISVVKEGIFAGEIGFRAMHDITEGGVMGAIWEICTAHETGALISLDKIPFDPVTIKLCEALHLDRYRLISSGSMLIVAAPKKALQIAAVCKEEGIDVTEIGVVTEANSGICAVDSSGGDRPFLILPPEADEIYKVKK